MRTLQHDFVATHQHGLRALGHLHAGHVVVGSRILPVPVKVNDWHGRTFAVHDVDEREVLTFIINLRVLTGLRMDVRLLVRSFGRHLGENRQQIAAVIKTHLLEQTLRRLGQVHVPAPLALPVDRHGFRGIHGPILALILGLAREELLRKLPHTSDRSG
ncbi:hypothetical protein SDC9_178045 [bioreactor metagenome]|uniref:Uncharacterized protein n=1 Tax=bioreactor metagenome TaxID=1076179 RepID=A0A645H2J8_9ZZZZ